MVLAWSLDMKQKVSPKTNQSSLISKMFCVSTEWYLMKRGKKMENNDAKKEMELLFHTTDALVKAEELIQKQDKMLENIILKTIEILANEIRKN